MSIHLFLMANPLIVFGAFGAFGASGDSARLSDTYKQPIDPLSCLQTPKTSQRTVRHTFLNAIQISLTGLLSYFAGPQSIETGFKIPLNASKKYLTSQQTHNTGPCFLARWQTRNSHLLALRPIGLTLKPSN